MGGSSLSSIVRVWVVTPPNPALSAPDRVTWTVSLSSSVVSSVTATDMVSVVSPGEKVSVPEARVKSSPEPAALPPLTA